MGWITKNLESNPQNLDPSVFAEQKNTCMHVWTINIKLLPLLLMLLTTLSSSFRLSHKIVTTSTRLSSTMSGIPMLNGNLHPPIGFGTYKIGYLPPSSASALAGTEVSNPVDCAAVVCTALSNGYRFIDCAEFYGNEDKVGDGIAQWKSKGGNVDDLFIVSKIWTSTLSSSPSAIKSQVLKTLTDLNIPKIDIMTIHWPVPTHHISAYHTLCECVDEGLVGGLGVSNYGIEDYNDLMSR